MFNSFNLYKAEWLGLVFKNRNQNYGAFQLRLQAPKIILKSFLFSAFAFVAFFALPRLFQVENLTDTPADDQSVIDVILPKDVVFPEKEKQRAPSKGKVGPPASPNKHAVKQVSFSSNIKVTDRPDVQEPITSSDMLASQVTNTADVGELGKGLGAGNFNGSESGLGNATAGNGNDVLMAAEVNPAFPGGMDAWTKFIESNLRYPSQAAENNIQGKVFISFVVEKDGRISDVKIIKGVGYGCDEEAMRVIKKSPRWNPGMQNGRPVRVRYQMPISYSLL